MRTDTFDPNEFALALYGELRRQPGNHVSSPLSIALALVVAHAGARGSTAEGIRKALQLPAAGAVDPCTSFARLCVELGQDLTVANALWHSRGTTPLPEFCEELHRLGTDVAPVDFAHVEEVRRAINEWIRQRTAGLIPELFGSEHLSPLTRLVFANAVYFKGKWSLPFDEQDTRMRPFFIGPGRKVSASLMRQTTAGGYLEAEDHQSLTLRYQGGDLAMMILLPGERDSLEALESRLSAEFLSEHLRARFTTVNVVLPRFKIRWGTADLTRALADLGMQQAFSSEAVFSGINGRRPPDAEALHIDKILHQACIEVNEEGTEAAAATAAVTLGIAEPPPIPLFRADRPFLFMLCDLRTGAILFMGRVVDPTCEVSGGNRVNAR